MTKIIVWIILSLGLFSCFKKNDPVPVNPIVGTWSMHRIEYSDFPSYYNHNRVDSNATRIGTISYVFKRDSTYFQSYAGYNSFYPASIPLGIVEGTELGVWQPISATIVSALFGFIIKPKTQSPLAGIRIHSVHYSYSRERIEDTVFETFTCRNWYILVV